DAFIAARSRHADVAASLQEARRVRCREVDVQLDVVLAVVEDLNAFALRRHGLTPSRFAEGESSSSPQARFSVYKYTASTRFDPLCERLSRMLEEGWLQWPKAG